MRREKRRDRKTGAVREFWFVDIDFEHADGRRERVRKVSPVQTRRGAEQYEREVRQQLLAGSYGKEVITKEAPTLTQFVERFLTYSENNNKPSTVASKRQMLTNHIVPFFGSKRLDGIGPAEIEDFKAVMRHKLSGARPRKESPTKWAIKKRYGEQPKQLSLKSINNSLAVLRKLLSLAQEHGVLDHMPRVRLFSVEKPSFDFLDFGEAERLVQATEPEW